MALDRVVTLHLEAEGTRDEDGNYIPGPTTDVRVWAQLVDGGESDSLTSGGVIVVRRAVVTIRWRADVIDTPPSRMEFTDDYNVRYNVETVQDFAARRRFISISATEAT